MQGRSLTVQKRGLFGQSAGTMLSFRNLKHGKRRPTNSDGPVRVFATGYGCRFMLTKTHVKFQVHWQWGFREPLASIPSDSS